MRTDGPVTLPAMAGSWRPSDRGRFITIEGPEGGGKTTQAARLADHLVATGEAVVRTREPGGTALGERLRDLLLAIGDAAEPIEPMTDALLFSAARRQLVAEVIRPALDAGTTVICTRYADSTLAYQGYGAGLPLADLRDLERIATGGLRPDLTILLDLPAGARASGGRHPTTRRGSSSASTWTSIAGSARDSSSSRPPNRIASPSSTRAGRSTTSGRRSGEPSTRSRAPRAVSGEPNRPAERIIG